MLAPHEYPDHLPRLLPARGRGAATLNPANRFESIRLHVLGDHLDELLLESLNEDPSSTAPTAAQVPTRFFIDRTRSIINRVDSPDLDFHWSINPYRGCEHGCIYCYARPTHENLGLSSGLDFESRIIVKLDAANLLRRELARPSWRPEPIMMCGVTDCYQPVEARLKITRACLEVLADARQPISLITKNHLIVRDAALLTEMARHNVVGAAVSITTLDSRLAARMEPRASSPADRLRAVRDLAAAGIPVTVMVAPVIPGLTDHEIPALLKAAADSGASAANWVMLRLPFQVKSLFLDWLQREFPDRAARVEHLVRETRAGELSDSTPGRRLRGAGSHADTIRNTFSLFARRLHLDKSLPPFDLAAFRRPTLPSDGPTLFDPAPA